MCAQFGILICVQYVIGFCTSVHIQLSICICARAHVHMRVCMCWFNQIRAHNYRILSITKKVREKEKPSGIQIIAQSSCKSYHSKKKQMKHFDKEKDGMDR